MELKKRRRICWPEFDLTCLEGGCLYCADGRWITWDTLRRKVQGDVRQKRAFLFGTHNPRVQQQ